MFCFILLQLMLFDVSRGSTDSEDDSQDCQFTTQGNSAEILCENLQNLTGLLPIFGQWEHSDNVSVSLVVSGCADNETTPWSWRHLGQHISYLTISQCSNIKTVFKDFKHFRKLESLSVHQSNLDTFQYNCDHLQSLEKLDLSENSLEKFTLTKNCKPVTSLKQINLSGNNFVSFDLSVVSRFPNLEELDLGDNSIETVIHSEEKLTHLASLDLSHNPRLEHVCDNVLTSLSNVTSLILTNTGVRSHSWRLWSLLYPGQAPSCSCQLLIEDIDSSEECQHKGDVISVNDIPNQLDCRPVEINGDIVVLSSNESTVFDDEMAASTNSRTVFAGEPLLLECPHTGNPSPQILWLTPRLELIKHRPDPVATCEGESETVSVCDTLCQEENAYKPWPGHFSVLDNGSLVIDQFGWRDRGQFRCYLDNRLGNDSVSVKLDLDPRYRHVIYLWSLLYGLVTAVGFLALTLLGKLIHYLLWNYGCCYCCACCHHDPPPKIKRLAAALDSIEQYRIGQLEKLRENYTQQSQRIRDNYTLQLERLRETYTSQKKDESNQEPGEQGGQPGAGGVGIKEQYWENVNRVREYSNMQLTKLHENYIFQRQRLRKFSVQNYVKIRETGKYTQKTLNRVIESMPTLQDMTNCRQGGPDWDDEEEDDPPQMELMMIREENQSLYFTPSGTPQRETVDMISPVKRKSHKRMVSNLSNFLPFWWGMGQSELGQQPDNPNTTTTVAIIEHAKPDNDNGLVVGEETLKLVIHNTSSNEVSTTESSLPTDKDSQSSSTGVEIQS